MKKPRLIGSAGHESTIPYYNGIVYKAIRTDTREYNRPAASLYESMRFHLVGSVPVCLHGVIKYQRTFLEREVKCDD